MARNYDSTDLLWTSRGDVFIGGDGDLMDTEFDPLRSFVQEVRTRTEADQGDWKNFPNLGATLSKFVGEPNNRVTSEGVKVAIRGALARDGFVNTRDMKLTAMPIDIDKLLVRVSFKVAPTARNASTETLIYNALYNYSNNNVYFIR